MPGPSLQDAQQIFSNAGLRTQYGVILPPGARVAAFVRSTGLQSGDDAFLATNLVTTLAAGLSRVRSGMGDYVVCLPGHTESVDAAATTAFAAALVAGTRIIGIGQGSNKPTFGFTATASSWAVAVNSVLITGLKFTLTGSGFAVGAGIAVTGNDFACVGNEVELVTATAAFGIFVSISGTAARFDVSGNVCYSVAAGGAGTNFSVVSSTGSHGRFAGNEIVASCAVATGAINITSAFIGLKIRDNLIENLTAASVAALTFGNVACDGMVIDNRLFCKNGGAMVSGTNVIVIGAAALVGFDNNLCSNDPKVSGIILPTVDT